MCDFYIRFFMKAKKNYKNVDEYFEVVNTQDEYIILF